MPQVKKVLKVLLDLQEAVVFQEKTEKLELQVSEDHKETLVNVESLVSQDPQVSLVSLVSKEQLDSPENLAKLDFLVKLEQLEKLVLAVSVVSLVT